MDSPLHHQLARQACETILAKLRAGDWSVPGMDRSRVRYGRMSGATWPLVDGLVIDDAVNLALGVEFKPPTENRRGCLTGLGQALAYLRDYSASLLVLPALIEGFRIAEYVAALCRALPMQAVPVGVASYEPSAAGAGSLGLTLLRAVPGDIPLRQAAVDLDSTYWANWRDTPPSVLDAILSIADSRRTSRSTTSQRDVWQEFWTTKFDVAGASATLRPTPASLSQFNGQPIIPFGKAKERLSLKVASGDLSSSEALAKLARTADPTAANDNAFHSLRKNHFNFMNQLGLWDSEARLTADGLLLLQVGRVHGIGTPAHLDALARLVLLKGAHLELILDFEVVIERFVRGLLPDVCDSRTMTAAIWDDLDMRGLVKKNPARRTSGAKRKFVDELTLWHHLGIIKKRSASFFFPHRGFLFDWARITRLISTDTHL